MSYGRPRRFACCSYWWPAASQFFQLPMVKCQAETAIQSTVSRTVLRQTFTSPEPATIPECTYNFPLYDGSTIVDFKCYVGDRVIQGVVKEKEEAREDYDAAVSQGQQAGLVDQSDTESDVFKTSVGNLPAHGSIIVEITYMNELKHDMETDSLRFEMPTAIAPRYGGHDSFATGSGHLPHHQTVPGYRQQQNGIPWQTHHSHNFGFHLSPDHIPDEQGFDLVATIELSEPILKVESPTHPIAVALGRLDEGDQELSLNKCRAELHLPATSGLSSELVLVIKAKDMNEPFALLETSYRYEDSAIMASLVPRFNLPQIQPEIVFVCDRSGSMGWSGTFGNSNNLNNEAPIQLAVSALKVMLRSLPKGVKFNICSFGSDFNLLYAKSEMYCRQTLEHALAHVNSFTANFGGTETYRAIDGVLTNRLRHVPLEIILLTDGDITRQEELFTYINAQVEQSGGQIRVFPLGIGSGVSTALIEGIARAGNGFAQMVQAGERMDNRCVRMLKAALSPHINDYHLEILYEDGLEDESDFEVIETPTDSEATPGMNETSSATGETNSSLKSSISLFDKSVDPDMVLPSNAMLPKLSTPNFIQAPARLPALYSFSRTTVYLLFSKEATQKRPQGVVLRGTHEGTELELKIPLRSIGDGEMIHQLAARKTCQDLEEGRGWLYHAKVADKLVREKYPSRFSEFVKREAIRLGTIYQIMNRWCSFVAVEDTNMTTDTAQNSSSVVPQYHKRHELVGLGAAKARHATRGSSRSSCLPPSGSLFQAIPPPPPVQAAPAPSNSSPFGGISQMHAYASMNPGSGPGGGIPRQQQQQQQQQQPQRQQRPETGDLFATTSPGIFGRAAQLFGGTSTVSTPGGTSLLGTASPGSPSSSVGWFDTASPRNPSHEGSLFGTASSMSHERNLSPSAAAPPKSPSSGSSLFGTASPGSISGQNQLFSSGSTSSHFTGTALPEPSALRVSYSAPVAELASISRYSYRQRRGFVQKGSASPDSSHAKRYLIPPLIELSPVERLHQIIAEQDIDGFWDLTAAARLAGLLQISETTLRRGEGSISKEKDKAWITTIVVAYLENRMSAEKEVWELIVGKAKTWLEETLGEAESAALLKQATAELA